MISAVLNRPNSKKRKKKNQDTQQGHFPSDTLLVPLISVFVLLIMFVLVHTWTCVFDGGLLRFCCWCLKSPCLSLSSRAHNPYMTLSSWLTETPSRLFHPTQNNIVHLPPWQARTHSAVRPQRHVLKFTCLRGFWCKFTDEWKEGKREKTTQMSFGLKRIHAKSKWSVPGLRLTCDDSLFTFSHFFSHLFNVQVEVFQ